MNRHLGLLISLFLVFGLSSTSLSFWWLSDDIKVTIGPGDLYDQWPADLVHIDANTLVLVFDDNSLGEFRAHSLRSTDGGITFSAPVQLDSTCSSGCTTQAPRIAYSRLSDTLVAVFQRKGEFDNNPYIMCSFSYDHGISWTTPVMVSDNGDAANHLMPVVALNAITDQINVAWIDYRLGVGGDIYYSRSTDGGMTFSPNAKISIGVLPATIDTMPDIATYLGSCITVVYESDIAGNSLIYAATSLDGGQSFLLNLPVLNVGYAQHTPKIGFSLRTGRMHVTWCSSALGTSQIVCSTSVDQGSVFLLPVLVSDVVDGAMNPEIAVNSMGDVYIVWNDDRTGYQDCYLAASLNGGLSFTPDQVINHGPSDISHTSPVVSTPFLRQCVNVIWADFRDDPYVPELYTNLHEPTTYDNFTDTDFSNWSRAVTVERSILQAVDGDGFSCRFGTGSHAGRTAGELEQSYPLLQQGSIDFWFYDGYGSDPIYETVDFRVDVTAELRKSKIGVVRSIGIVNANNSQHYQSYDGSTWNVISDIPRADGWHHVIIDISDSGITMELDATDYFDYQPVYSDSVFTGFEEILFTGGDNNGPYYLDNVNINSEAIEEYLVPAVTPIAAILLCLTLGAFLVVSRKRG